MDRHDDRFLELNANVDYMAGRLADMIRHCMRSIASSDGGRYQALEALQDFVVLRKLIDYSVDVSFYEVFEKALADLRVRSDDVLDEAILDAAKTGLQLLIELSCSDGAARGRASKRRQDFLDALKHIDEAREYRRQKRREPKDPD
jgi:hypothetical protein